MIVALAMLSATPNVAFTAAMNRYVACLTAATPSDIARHDLATRARIYRAAAARCASEREAAVAAAVEGRQLGTSPAAARALANDIIDTLDPMSAYRKR